MSKVTAPLLSFNASGAIAKTQVYARWKGIPYVRQHVVPSNPQTAEQTLTRSTFSFLNNVWKFAPAAMTDAYNAYASGQPLTGRNGFLKQNISNLRTAADLTDLVFSPGARGGIAAAGISTAPGAGEIVVTLTAPTLPTGWTIQAAWAAAIRDQDPQTGVLYSVSSATDAATPFTPTITGLTAAELYIVGGWFSFVRPDGLIAYGRSLNDSDTPS